MELTSDELAMIKVSRLMAEADRQRAMDYFWIGVKVILLRWSTPKNKLGNLADLSAEFKKSIPKLREAANMSAAELADKMELDAATVESWERGTSLPTASQIFHLAAVLNCSLEQIFGCQE